MRTLFYSSLEVGVRQILQLSVSIILARLLMPEDFGTVAVVYLFTSFAVVFVEAGMPASLIRKQDATIIDESTIFWLNVLVGLLASGAIFLSANKIAEFFGQPRIAILAQAASVQVLISCLGSVHAAILTKNLKMGEMAVTGIVSTTFSSMLALSMALRGYGVWALIAQGLAASVLSTLFLWRYSQWRPSFVFSLSSIRDLGGMAATFLITGLADSIFQKISSAAIARGYGVSEAGYFNRADNIRQMPTGLLTAAVGRLIYPYFSKAAAEDVERLHVEARKILGWLLFINTPVMFILALLSDSLVWLLLGNKWSPSAPLLQILCYASLMWPFNMVNMYAIASLGLSKEFVIIELYKKAVGIVAIIFAVSFGAYILAWVLVALSAVSFVFDTIYSKKVLSYRRLEQIIDWLPIVGLTTVSIGITYIVDSQLAGSHFMRLIILPLILFSSYFSFAWLFNVPQEIRKVSLVRQHLKLQ